METVKRLRNTWKKAMEWLKPNKLEASKPEAFFKSEEMKAEERKPRKLRYKRPHRHHRSIDRPIW